MCSNCMSRSSNELHPFRMSVLSWVFWPFLPNFQRYTFDDDKSSFYSDNHSDDNKIFDDSNEFAEPDNLVYDSNFIIHCVDIDLNFQL